MMNRQDLNKSDAATGTRQSVGIKQGNSDNKSRNVPALCRSFKFKLPPQLEIFPRDTKVDFIEGLSSISPQNFKKNKKQAKNLIQDLAVSARDYPDLTLTSYQFKSGGKTFKVTSEENIYRVELESDIDRIRIDGIPYDLEGVELEHFETFVAILRKLQGKKFIMKGKTVTEESNYFDLQPESLEVIDFHNPLSLVNCDIIAYVYSLIRCKNIFDVIACSWLYLRTKDQVSKHLKEYMESCIDHFVTAYNAKINEELVAESKYTFKDISEHYALFRNSEIVTQIMNVFNSVIAATVFMGYKEKPDFNFYKKFSKQHTTTVYHPDFIMTLVNSAISIMEKLSLTIQHRDINYLYHTGDNYSKWYERSVLIREQFGMLHNPEAFGFTESQFLVNLEVLIRDGDIIAQSMKRLRNPEFFRVLNYVSTFKTMLTECKTHVIATKPRDMPFCALVFGNSSIGKSSIIAMLFRYHAAAANLPYGPEFRYDLNAANKHMDNYKPSMWCVHVDDMGNINPEAKMEDYSMQYLFGIAGITPYNTIQADLQDKGKAPMRCRQVLASTNVKHLNFRHYFSFPAAAARRLPIIITPLLKEEFDKDGKLDTVAAQKWIEDNPGNAFPDFWVFCVDKIQMSFAVSKEGHAHVKPGPVRYQRIKYNDILMDKVDLKTFLEWYHHAVVTHESANKSMQVSLNRIGKTEICTQCHLPEGMCHCEPEGLAPQSLVDFCVWRSLFGDPNDTSNMVPDLPKDEVDEYFINAESALRTLKHFAQQSWTNSGRMNLLSLVLSIIFAKIGFGFLAFLCLTPFIFNSYAVWFEPLIFYSFATLSYYHLKYSHKEWYPWYFNKMYHSMGWIIANYFRIKGSIHSAHYWFFIGKNATKKQIVVSSIVGSLAILYFYKKYRELESQSTPLDFKKDEKFKSNPYNPNKRQVTQFDSGKASGTAKNMSQQDFIKKIGRNIFQVKMSFSKDLGSVTTHFQMVCLGSYFYIANYHSFARAMESNIALHLEFHDGGPVFTSVIMSNDVYRIEGSDLVILFHENFPRRKCITQYFASKEFASASYEGTLVYRSKDSTLQQIGTKQYSKFEHASKILDGVSSEFPFKESIAEKPTAYGFSGGLHIAWSGFGPVILGIHSMGEKNPSYILPKRVIVCCAYREILEEFQKCIEKTYPRIEDDFAPLLKKSSFKATSATRSHLDFLECPKNYVYYGTTETRSSANSLVEFTPLCEEVKPFIKKQYTKPDMTWKPFNIALRQYTNPTIITRDFVDLAATLFLEHVVESFPENLKIDYLKPMPPIMAVNGKPQIRFFDGINRSTSAGFPYNRSKLYYLEDWISDIYPNGVIPTDEIMEDRKVMLDLYKQSQRAHAVFKATLKDEAVTLEKAQAGKTRVFMAASFPFIMIVREYFIPIVKLLQENPYIFCLAVGINASSCEWHELTSYLSEFPNWLDGDYSAFDKGMSRLEVARAMDFLIAISVHFGYFSDEDITVMQAIKEDMVQAVIDYDGSVLSFMGGNPSGNPLTVIINCIVNVFRFIAAYNATTGRTDFFQNVRPITYGDDVVCTVTDEVCDEFNFVTISEVFSRWNIKFTDAAKSSNAQPFSKRDQIQFLKRSFSYNKETETFLAPLEEESIFKSMYIWNRSKAITKEDQMAQVIESASMEYFQYGRDIFDQKHIKLREWYARFSKKELKSFDYYLEKYKISVEESTQPKAFNAKFCLGEEPSISQTLDQSSDSAKEDSTILDGPTSHLVL